MNEEKKLGLLEQFEIALIRPKRYNELLENKKSRRWLYMLVLAVMLVIIEAVLPVAAWDVSVGGLENFIKKGLPTFEVTSEGLTIEDEIEIDLAGIARVIVDPSVDSFTKSDVDSNYSSQILVSKSNALFVNANMAQEVKFSSLGSGVIDNEALVAVIPWIRVFFGVYLLMLLVSKILVYLFWSIVFALVCRTSAKTEDGRVVTISQAFEISFYAKTLSAIITSINICLGGYIDESILFIATLFLIMGYIRMGEVSVLHIRTGEGV